jgi:hypothetical protein
MLGDNGLLRSAAMTVDRPLHSRGAPRPRFASTFFPPSKRGSRECRVLAAPAVSCAMCGKKCAHEHTGTAEARRHSLRNGLTAYAVISPEPNSSGLRHCRLDDASIRLDQNSHRQLGTSHGCQDHTVLPYATSAVILRAVLAHGRIRPANNVSRLTLSRPPHPVPRS